MELYALKELSGTRAAADPAQLGWVGPSHEWLSRRLAVMCLKARLQSGREARRERRPHRLLRLRGRGNRTRDGLPRPAHEAASETK